MKEELVFLSLGSNKGCRYEFLRKACQGIAEEIGEINQVSSIFVSEAWGYNDSKNYLNIVVELKTKKSPIEILAKCLEIEKKLGRERKTNAYEARVIDIDVLFIGNQILNTISLNIPHPRLHERKFVLMPMFELDPEFIHPLIQKNIRDLLAETQDNSQIRKFRDFEL